VAVGEGMTDFGAKKEREVRQKTKAKNEEGESLVPAGSRETRSLAGAAGAPGSSAVGTSAERHEEPRCECQLGVGLVPAPREDLRTTANISPELGTIKQRTVKGVTLVMTARRGGYGTARGNKAKRVAQGLVLAGAEGGESLGVRRRRGSVHVFLGVGVLGSWKTIAGEVVFVPVLYFETLQHILPKLPSSLFLLGIGVRLLVLLFRAMRREHPSC
jgi:hypothetical protein